jgi:hypothetical protein
MEYWERERSYIELELLETLLNMPVIDDDERNTHED